MEIGAKRKEPAASSLDIKPVETVLRCSGVVLCIVAFIDMEIAEEKGGRFHYDM